MAGSFTMRVNISLRGQLYTCNGVKPSKMEISIVTTLRRAKAEYIYVSNGALLCWHQNSHSTAAVYKK